jgi:predicted RNA-binding protein associated with RNAse of E/G family
MDGPAYIETKRTLDGREQHFATHLLLRTPNVAVVRYSFTGTTPVTVSGFVMPPGSQSTGFFWRSRSYDLYHIARADGSPIADRFDVVEQVRIGAAGVVFTDLLLDLWVSPLGEARFEDEDEVEQAHERGLIDDQQRALISRTAQHLARQHKRVIAGALALLDKPRPQR